jgi:hypothetical protein
MTTENKKILIFHRLKAAEGKRKIKLLFLVPGVNAWAREKTIIL